MSSPLKQTLRYCKPQGPWPFIRSGMVLAELTCYCYYPHDPEQPEPLQPTPHVPGLDCWNFVLSKGFVVNSRPNTFFSIWFHLLYKIVYYSIWLILAHSNIKWAYWVLVIWQVAAISVSYSFCNKNCAGQDEQTAFAQQSLHLSYWDFRISSNFDFTSL